MEDRQQLIEMRKQIILSKMEGKSEAERTRAIRNLDRMSFSNYEDFMSYVSDATGETAIDSPAEASQAEMEELFKNLNI